MDEIMEDLIEVNIVFLRSLYVLLSYIKGPSTKDNLDRLKINNDLKFDVQTYCQTYT
jgi:hypothetical protein